MDLVGHQNHIVLGAERRQRRISSTDQTVPPGLCGLQKNTTLVRGVSNSRSASRSIA